MGRQKTGRRRRFKLRHLFLVVLLILVGWFAWFRTVAHYRLDKRLDALRAQGYPMSLEELDRAYRLPNGTQNAAPFYLDAFAAFVEWDQEARKGLPRFGKAPWPARTEPLDASTLQLVQEFLSDNRKTLSLLHEATDIEHCRYLVDLGGGAAATPWMLNFRACALLLSLEAMAQCEQGDTNAALESVRANLALARSLDLPSLLHRQVHIAARAVAYNCLERIINRTALTDEQLGTLSRWIEASHDEEGYRWALVGERCLVLRAFESPGDHLGGPSGPPNKLVHLLMAPRRVLGLHDKDVLGCVDLMQDHIDALELPCHERLAVGESIEKAVAGGQRAGLLTRLLMPAFGRTLQLEVRCIAHLRAAQTALAVERYRLAEGRLPGSLEDLVPVYLETVPQDPFDGRELRYAVLETGFVVYSIGEDLSDDGGTEREERKRDAQGKHLWDVTFYVQR